MAKQYARAHCGYNIASLQKVVDEAMEHVKPENISKFFRKVEDFHQAYNAGNDGNSVYASVKEYKSHRRAYL